MKEKILNWLFQHIGIMEPKEKPINVEGIRYKMALDINSRHRIGGIKQMGIDKPCRQ